MSSICFSGLTTTSQRSMRIGHSSAGSEGPAQGGMERHRLEQLADSGGNIIRGYVQNGTNNALTLTMRELTLVGGAVSLDFSLDFLLLSFSFLIFSFVSFLRRSRIAARCSRRSSNSSSLLLPSPPPRFLVRIASIFACNLARRVSMLSDCGSGTMEAKSSSESGSSM